MKKACIFGIILYSLLAVLTSVIPHSAEAEVSRDALKVDAEVYARDNGITVEEALQRLDWQMAAGELNSILTQNAPDTFAGLWIQHSPQFRIVVQFTKNGEETLKRYASSSLSGLIELRSAGEPLSRLRDVQSRVLASLQKNRIHADSSINIFTNQVEVNIPETQLLSNSYSADKLAFPEDVKLVTVKNLAQPTADLIGGISLEGLSGGATAGFTVVDADGTRGVTTCAHTDTILFYLNYGIPFWLPCKESRRDTFYDIQWHSSGVLTVLNRIHSGQPEQREITGSVLRPNQAVGSFIVKYGKNTGYTAGYIKRVDVSLDYIPDCEPTFIEVDHSRTYPVLCDVGDSGGPWFLGNNAYGTTCAKDGNGNGYYMAVDYFSGVGITLLTAP